MLRSVPRRFPEIETPIP